MARKVTKYTDVTVTDVENDGPDAVYDRIAENLEYARDNSFHTIYIGPGVQDGANGTILLTTLEQEVLLDVLQTMLSKIKGTLS